MPDWNALRRRAYIQHQRLRVHLPADAPLLPPADQLLEAAEKETGVDRRAVPRGDSLLAGAHAVLDRDFPGIWYAIGPNTNPARQRFAQAHEFAHYWLHPEIGEDRCVADDTPEAFAPPSFRLNNAQVAEGYSHKERRESEANLFAAELLLPAPVLRRVFPGRRLDCKPHRRPHRPVSILRPVPTDERAPAAHAVQGRGGINNVSVHPLPSQSPLISMAWMPVSGQRRVLSRGRHLWTPGRERARRVR